MISTINKNELILTLIFFQVELDKFTLPKSKNIHEKDIVEELNKNEKEIAKENIDPIRARQLSYHKIKSYSLENKIKIILFNSKLYSYQ